MNQNTIKLQEKIKEIITGEVISDEKALKKFSRDQSIYEIYPQAVVFPQSMDDLIKVIEFASSEGIPITARGGGSGTAGSALGKGIVIALKRKGFLNGINNFEVDNDVPYVTVEPGVYHDNLQKFLKEKGFYLPADPSSGAISRLGGNIATKASGPHALLHGSIDRFLEHVQFISYKGEVIDTMDKETIPSRIKNPLEELKGTILSDNESKDFLRSRMDMKISSGYNMFAFLRTQEINKLVAQLLVGSVGTLGFITNATLLSEPYIPEKAAMLLYFKDLSEAGDAVCKIKELGVAAIEIMNRDTINVLLEKVKNLNKFSQNAHMLLIEFEGESRFDQIEKVKQIVRKNDYNIAGKPAIATNPQEIEHLWKVRKQIFPVARNFSPVLKAISVVNDIGVPTESLADIIPELQQVFKKHDIITMIYGHAGSGNLHLRPLFDISKQNLKKRIQNLADDVYSVVFKYKGTITAEHSMGRLRAPYLEKEWGSSIYGYMKKVKGIFDPDGVFNPGVMFSNRPITDHMQKDLLEVTTKK